jgi:hypothetical protein
LKEEAERQLEKIKKQLDIEKEKNVQLHQGLKTEKQTNFQLTQHLQSANEHVEHYSQVCANVQTIEGAHLFLVRTLNNGIEKSPIAAELQRISRSTLSLQELANLALTNPLQVFDNISCQNFSHMLRHSRRIP